MDTAAEDPRSDRRAKVAATAGITDDGGDVGGGENGVAPGKLAGSGGTPRTEALGWAAVGGAAARQSPTTLALNL